VSVRCYTSHLVEALGPNAGAHAALRRYKWHLIAFVALITACDLLRSTFQGIYFPSSTLTVLAGAFFVVTMLIVAIIFIVSAIRLLKKLQFGLNLMAQSQLVRHKNRQVRRLTRRILISAIGMLIAVGGTVLVTTNFFRKPYGFLVTWMIITAGICITSLAQVMAFVVPKTARVSPHISLKTKE